MHQLAAPARRALALGALAVLVVAPAGAFGSSSATQAASTSAVLYVAGGHLWLTPVDGGALQLIRTPWRMSTTTDYGPDVQESPDGERIALGDGNSRLAVIKLATSHVTVLLAHRCKANCDPPGFAWSPNGRYLAVYRPTTLFYGTLLVWDSSTGIMRRLSSGVPSAFAGMDWSHDSTRILTGIGTLNLGKDIFPVAVIINLQGHIRKLAVGTGYGWSPDDKFVGIVRSHNCGANTCDDGELVYPAAGGVPSTLISHADSNFEQPSWAPQPGGYAFDRWLLGPHGHLARRVAGPTERVDSWEPDGSHFAVQTYHPYYSTPDALYIATPQGSLVHLYTDGPNAGCGACSKDVYTVTWSHNGTLVAFSTPEYPTPKMVTVYPRFYVAAVNSGQLTRVPVPGPDTFDLLGFVDNDQELVLRSDKTIYRFTISTGRLDVVATGVNQATTPELYPPAS